MILIKLIVVILESIKINVNQKDVVGHLLQLQVFHGVSTKLEITHVLILTLLLMDQLSLQITLIPCINISLTTLILEEKEELLLHLILTLLEVHTTIIGKEMVLLP